MSTVLPLFYVGRNLKNAKITPGVVDPLTGIFTKGTASDLGASFVVEYVRFSQTVSSEMIKGANAIVENNVNIADGFEVAIGEIKGNLGSGLVLNAWVGFDEYLVEVVVTPPGATQKFTIQAVCRRGGLNDEYGEGKSVMELTGRAAGVPIAYVLAGEPLPY